ncbi:Ubiquitin family protein isoform 1 [Hibiscus syriacus]|uniref:Ubiquitin family protein isoform 1 n=1 Tax=Hibiscus syriacus TaxID=106335 RepID=A0A6A3C874_HIBSY|nr:Ubiquitin family protein isoform 1 [Hibiscus syriacus]
MPSPKHPQDSVKRPRRRSAVPCHLGTSRYRVRETAQVCRPRAPLMVQQMPDSKFCEFGLLNPENNSPACDKQRSDGEKKTPLRVLGNENRIVPNPTGSSPFPKDKGPCICKVSGTKRASPECPLSPSQCQSPSDTPANRHLVYARRKCEAELSKNSAFDCMGTKFTPLPKASLTSSSAKRSVPLPIGKSATKLKPLESNQHPVVAASPLCDSPNGIRELHWEEQYYQLQTLLKKLDQSNQEDYTEKKLKILIYNLFLLSCQCFGAFPQLNSADTQLSWKKDQFSSHWRKICQNDQQNRNAIANSQRDLHYRKFALHFRNAIVENRVAMVYSIVAIFPIRNANWEIRNANNLISISHSLRRNPFPSPKISVPIAGEIPHNHSQSKIPHNHSEMENQPPRTMTSDLPDSIQRGEEEIWFHFPPAYTCFGRKEFCLITGLRFGYDDVGRYTRHITRPSWLSRVFPDESIEKPNLHVDDMKKLFNKKDGFTRMNDVDVVRIWIFEAFPSMRTYALKSSDDIPRAISWKRKRMLDWEDLIPYATINNATDKDATTSISPFSTSTDESRELRDEVNALREEIGTLRDNDGAWRVEVSTLRGEVATLREMVVSLQNEVHTLRNERTDKVDALRRVFLARQSSRIRRRARAIKSPYTPMCEDTARRSPTRLSSLKSPLLSLKRPLSFLESPLPPFKRPLSSLKRSLPPFKSPIHMASYVGFLRNPLTFQTWIQVGSRMSYRPVPYRGRRQWLFRWRVHLKNQRDESFALGNGQAKLYPAWWEVDKVFIPVLERNHWLLVELQIPSLKAIVYDSMINYISLADLRDIIKGWSSYLAKYLDAINYWTRSGNKKPKKLNITVSRRYRTTQQRTQRGLWSSRMLGVGPFDHRKYIYLPPI